MSRNRFPMQPGNPNGGIALLPPQNQPPQIVVNGGPLMNDVQLVAMIANTMIGDPKIAVDTAVEIVARSFVAVNTGALARRIEAMAAEAQPKIEG